MVHITTSLLLFIVGKWGMCRSCAKKWAHSEELGPVPLKGSDLYSGILHMKFILSFKKRKTSNNNKILIGL